ncbi:MAG: O-antigen ligase family protein [Candidatus Omnitrophota bacterium]
MSKEKIIRICEGTIEWCFYALLVVATFSISLVEVAAGVMIAAWLVKTAVSRDLRFLRSVPVRLIILFFLWTVLSCLNSDYFSESFRGVFSKVAKYSLIFIIAATSLRKERIIKRTFFVIAATAVVICANGFFQYFAGFDLIRHRQLISLDYLRRISSSFVHPNDFGVYLIIVSTVFISFVLSRNSDLKYRISALIALLFSLGALFLTKSRGAWISFSAAFLVLGILKSRRMVAVFLAILLVIFVMLPYTAQERIFSLADLKSGTTWERLMLWKGTINMIKEHPVLGFGINTYSRNFPKYRPPDYPDARYSHNCYLHMASEVGIVGALLFLIFLVTVFVYSLMGILRMSVGPRKSISTGLFAGLVGFSLNCIVDTHLYSVTLAVFFYLLLGFCFSLSRVNPADV